MSTTAHPAIVNPPLMLSACPVMKSERLEAKNTTASVTSSGFARRRNGIYLTRPSRIVSGSVANSGVSVGPGHTQSTLIRWRAISLAKQLRKGDEPTFGAGVDGFHPSSDSACVAGDVDDLCSAFGGDDRSQERM